MLAMACQSTTTLSLTVRGEPYNGQLNLPAPTPKPGRHAVRTPATLNTEVGMAMPMHACACLMPTALAPAS